MCKLVIVYAAWSVCVLSLAFRLMLSKSYLNKLMIKKILKCRYSFKINLQKVEAKMTIQSISSMIIEKWWPESSLVQLLYSQEHLSFPYMSCVYLFTHKPYAGMKIKWQHNSLLFEVIYSHTSIAKCSIL